MLKLFLCLKYLRRKKIVFFGIAAVCLSCALLIVVSSLFSAFIKAIEKNASETMGDIVVWLPGRSVVISDYEILIKEFEADPLISAASGVLMSQGLVHLGKGNVQAVTLWGIDPVKESQVTGLKGKLLKQKDISGIPSFGDKLGDKRSISGFAGIGVLVQPDVKTDRYDFDKALGFIGKQVVLTTGAIIEDRSQSEQKGSSESSVSMVGRKSFKRKAVRLNISDVIYSGIYHLDRRLILMPLDDLQNLLFSGSKNTKVIRSIRVKLAEGVNSEAGLDTVRKIWGEFAREKLGWGSFAISETEIKTASQMQSRHITEIRKQMGVSILIFGVLSGAIVLLIFCIFYMIVITRRRDIAVIKSCGMGNVSVAQLFIWFGAIVGIIGSVLGTLSGYLIIRNINAIEGLIRILFGIKLWQSSVYIFTQIPNQIDLFSVSLILPTAVAACILGSLIPALSAAELEPVEILRYE